MTCVLHCSDDEELPTCATAAPLASPLAADESVEPDVAHRVTRDAVKKVPRVQHPKRLKKAREADVSLDAHASTVSLDDVSKYFLLAFLSYTHALTHSFSQVLLKRFVALGTECTEYLKVAKASEGIILTSSHHFSSVLYPLVFI
jgi:hypothetical protein